MSAVRRTGAFGVCLAIAHAAFAQDEAPYRWIVTGETVETLQAEFVPLFATDQATPEGVVAAYVALSDGRVAAEAVDEAARAVIAAATRHSLEPFEAALLTPDARRSLAQEIEAINAAAPAFLQTAGVTQIVGVNRADELAYVETVQTHTTRELIETEGWRVSEEQISRLFTCVAIDGQWFVQSIAQWRIGEDSPPDNPTHAWVPELSPLVEVYVWMMAALPEQPAALPVDSPRRAAVAVFEVLQLRAAQLHRESLLRTQDDRTVALQRLLAPSTVAVAWELAGVVAEQINTEQPHLKRRAIKAIELEVDEATITFEPAPTIAPLPALPGDTLIRVRRNGDAWQIAEAGYHAVTFFGSTYIDTPIVYALP